MPGPGGPWGDALAEAVRGGRVSEAAIDDKVLRILRLAARVGALDGISVSASPGAWAPEAISTELRATAAASFVLARNHGALLPLSGGSLRRVAVVGPNAAAARSLGGGSATVYPPYTVSPLEGLRAALPQSEITHARGARPYSRIPVVALDAEVRLLGGEGQVLHSERRHTGRLRWNNLDPAVTTIEVRARLTAEETGEHVIGVSGVGRVQLDIDGHRHEETLALRPGTDLAEAHMHPPQAGARVTLTAGREAEIAISYVPDREDPSTILQLNVETPHGPEEEMLDEAVALARAADVAIVVVGTNEEVESEGFDRDSLALPGAQDELVRQVAAANPRTVVVVNAGAPVLAPWLEEVPAVLLAWFPGQEGGNAIADVLLGAAEPGGRLPTTWPASEDGLPGTRPVDGVLEYSEGLRIGYRRDGAPLLPFGHGLGYTQWEYLGIEAAGEGVRVRVVNAGTRRGREVVQVYGDGRLVGFAAVEADAGEEVVAEIGVDRRALARWDGGWVLEPGPHEVAAGRSFSDLRVATEIVLR
jgi:beta-glucosidase